MATIDVHTAVQDLEAAGADPKLAAAIAQGIARAAPARGTSGINILAAATGLGFTLITVVFGWFMVDASQQRADLRVGVERLSERVSNLEVSMSERFAGVESRLTRIENLLEERLPERR